jgi:hypothetical protein
VRFVAREVGPTMIGGLVAAQAVLWTIARPSGELTGSYIGQLLGAESILLLSIGLVLISTLPWVDEQVLTAADDADRAGLSVFMCGPRQMLSSFQNALRVAGVPARRIHREYFDWR